MDFTKLASLACELAEEMNKEAARISKAGLPSKTLKPVAVKPRVAAPTAPVASTAPRLTASMFPANMSAHMQPKPAANSFPASMQATQKGPAAIPTATVVPGAPQTPGVPGVPDPTPKVAPQATPGAGQIDPAQTAAGAAQASASPVPEAEAAPSNWQGAALGAGAGVAGTLGAQWMFGGKQAPQEQIVIPPHMQGRFYDMLNQGGY